MHLESSYLDNDETELYVLFIDITVPFSFISPFKKE